MKKLLFLSFALTILLTACNQLIVPDSNSSNNNNNGTVVDEDTNDENINTGDIQVLDAVITSDDGNNDSVANRGETLMLAVTLKNVSTQARNGVTAVISTDSPYATVLEDTDSGYYTIQPNAIDNGSNPGFKVKIDSNAPANQSISFYVAISSAEGSYSGSFSLTVKRIDGAIEYVSYGVIEEIIGNKNNIINPNETIRLRVQVRNKGTDTVMQLQGVLSSTSSQISISDNTDSYGSVPAGAVAAGTDTGYTVRFLSTLTNGDEVPFTIQFSDSFGNSWSDDFVITLADEPGNVVVVGHTVQGEPFGNGDGIPNPGETIDLSVTLRNDGSFLARNVTALISTSQAGITIVKNQDDSYGDIPIGATSAGKTGIPAGYRIQISSVVEPDTNVRFEVTISDSTGKMWYDSFTLTVKE